MSVSNDLQSRSVTAVKWSAVGTVAKFGMQLVAQIVLARILGPETYGLFAIGLVVLSFTNFFADFGFAWGLVQAEHITDEDIRFVFTWQLICGLLSALFLNIFAPDIAKFFNDARVENVIRWLSIASFLSAITAPSVNLLRRNLNFRALNLIQLASYIFGYLLVGIPLAYFGAEVWALIAAWIAQATFGLVCYMLKQPHPMRPLFRSAASHSLSAVGTTVFVTNICNWFLNNLDRIIVGRILNAHSVGLYSVGYNLANTPNSFLLGALQPAFLAVGARMQTDLAQLRKAYASVLATVLIVVTPLFILLSVLAQDLVVTMYGPAWSSSGIVLAILALAMPAYVTWGMSTPILWNTNRKQFETLLQLPVLGGSALLYLEFSHRGIEAVALIAAVTLLARALVVATYACRRLNLSKSDILYPVLRGIAMGSISAVSGLAGIQLACALGGNHLSSIVCASLAGFLALAVSSMLAPRFLLGKSVIATLGKFSSAIPRILNWRGALTP